MKKILLSFLFIFLIGCNAVSHESKVKEIDPDQADSKLKETMNNLEATEDGTKNGVYILQEDERVLYLFLSGTFLKKDHYFGEVEITQDDDILSIRMYQTLNKEDKSNRKLYKIEVGKTMDEIRVFKDDEATYIDTLVVLESD